MWLVDLKCKVLKSMLGPIANQIWVEPLLVFPDGTSNQLRGAWRKNAQSVAGLIKFLLDQQRVPKRSDVARYHPQIVEDSAGRLGSTTAC